MPPKWVVQDRNGASIYLTRERWNYILSYHEELEGLLDEVLNTVRYGRRRQEPLDPARYKYYRPCPALPPGYNTMVVVVKFAIEHRAEGAFGSNNFVITAWGTYIFREG